MRKLKSLILATYFFSILCGQSTQVRLLADLNKEKVGSNEPIISFIFQDKLHYYTHDYDSYKGQTEYKYWVFDGKEKFKDSINFGIDNLLKVKDSIVFLVSGKSIWLYDGKTETRIVDLNATPCNLTWYKNHLYFNYYNDVFINGLWFLNETGVPVKVLYLKRPDKILQANNCLYAAYKDGSIWTYNGTDPAYPDTNIINVDFATLTSFKNQLYYSSTDSIYGTELWKYNGTEPPILIEDLFKGISSSYPSNLVEINDHLYFMADTGSGKKLVFKYSGINSPEINHDFDNCPFDLSLDEDRKQLINKKLYAVYDPPNTCCIKDLWVYDGTNLPKKIASQEYYSIYRVAEFLGKVYYHIHEAHIGGNLLMTDGINPPEDAWLGDTWGSDPHYKTIYNNKLYFLANDGNGYDLWNYDGSGHPEIALEMNASKDVFTNMLVSGHQLYLTGPKILRIYNGTTDYKDIPIWGENDPDSSRLLISAVAFGNGIFYVCKRYNDSYKYLWYLSVDGTKRLIAKIVEGTSNLAIFNNNIYFTGTGRELGKELYVADSSGNSHLAVDIFPGPDNGNPGNLLVFNHKLFFTAQDKADSMSLWSYDGISVPVKIINIPKNWVYLKLTLFKNTLYFQLPDGLYSYDLNNEITKIYDTYFRVIYNTPEKLLFEQSKLIYEYDGMGPVRRSYIPEIVYGYNLSFLGQNSYIYFNNKTYFWQYNPPNNPIVINTYEIKDPLLFKDRIILTTSDGIHNNELFVLTQSDTILNLTGCNTYCYNDSCYTKSGIYYDTIRSESGKDSIVMLKIHINANSDSSYSFTSCSPVQSPSGRQIWAESGVYKDTIPNSCGCDSVITMNLTINHHSENQISESSCDSYITPGGKTVNATGIYIDTIPNYCGCDSIITMNLHIDHVDTSVIKSQNVLVSADLTAGHQWIDCDNGNVPIPGETFLTYSPGHSGRFALIVTQGTCVDTSSAYHVIITGNNEIRAEDNTVYPNPSDGKFNIDLGKIYKEAEIKIITPGGQVIHQYRFTDIRKTEISIDEPSGMYLIRIATPDGQKIKKVFKK